MRRILVDRARYKKRQRRGGGHEHVTLEEANISAVADMDEDQVLAVHDALDELEQVNPEASRIVKLRYFVGLTMQESATAMDLSLRSAERLWSYAKAWLRRKVGQRQT